LSSKSSSASKPRSSYRKTNYSSIWSSPFQMTEKTVIRRLQILQLLNSKLLGRIQIRRGLPTTSTWTRNCSNNKTTESLGWPSSNLTDLNNLCGLIASYKATQKRLKRIFRITDSWLKLFRNNNSKRTPWLRKQIRVLVTGTTGQFSSNAKDGLWAGRTCKTAMGAQALTTIAVDRTLKAQLVHHMRLNKTVVPQVSKSCKVATLRAITLSSKCSQTLRTWRAKSRLHRVRLTRKFWLNKNLTVDRCVTSRRNSTASRCKTRASLQRKLAFMPRKRLWKESRVQRSEVWLPKTIPTAKSRRAVLTWSKLPNRFSKFCLIKWI